MKTYKEIITLAQEKGYNPHITSNAYETLKRKDYEYLELCLIQKWLREEHLIWIWIELGSEYIQIYHIYNGQSIDTLGAAGDYNQSLLEGIYEALKLLP